jgi:crossover junction endodeoxyribonuclease RusA
MKIELAFPPKGLFPNRAMGSHWTKTREAKTAYKEECHWLTKQQMKNWAPTDAHVRVTIRFVMPDKRRRDTDNCLAAAKSGLDGMADALGINDQQFHPVIVYREYGKKPGQMIVEIEK